MVKAAVILHNFLHKKSVLDIALEDLLIRMTALEIWKKENGDGLCLMVKEMFFLTICEIL